MYSALHTLTLDGLQIAYRYAGRGPAVLMVHGWASSSCMWQRLMEDLSARYHCVALDLPGFGHSAKPSDGWYSIPRYVEVVTRFAQVLGLNTPTVIGHSMGGMTALALAAHNDGLARQVVAINPVVTGRTYLDLRMLANPRVSKPMAKFGRWFWPIASSDWVGPWFGPDRQEHFRRMRDEWRQSTPISLMAAARAIGQCDLTPRLADIRTPTLIVVGSRDLTAPPSEGKLAARRIPNARLAILPSGHLPTDDMPHETNTLIREFLDAHTSGPSAHRPPTAQITRSHWQAH